MVASCAGSKSADPKPIVASARPVAVIGDSITELASQPIQDAFALRYHADISARSGKRIDEMLPDVRVAVEDHPDAIVIDLGTNDVLQGHLRAPPWQAGFMRMVAMVEREPCVELTTISTRVNGWAARPAIANDINRTIADTVAARPNFHVIDWNAAVHEPGGSDLLVPDHIHPSFAGMAKLASLIRAALDRDCATG